MKLKAILQFLLWEIVNPFILKLKKNRKYQFDPKFAGLNIGCGIDTPPNWLGIDGGISFILLAKMPKPLKWLLFKLTNTSKNHDLKSFIKKTSHSNIILHDLCYGLPFPDNCIPNIFSSHFFEHIPKETTRFLLIECFRVMMPGGIIRICVPSLDHEVQKIKSAISEYENGNDIPIQKFVTSEKTGFINSYSTHRFMYNFELMSNLLKEVGFNNIVEQKFKAGIIPEVKDLDTRDGLIVEAIKPEIN